MNKRKVIEAMLVTTLIGGIGIAIQIHEDKKLEKERAEAEARVEEGFKELANEIKSLDDIHNDLKVLLQQRRQNLDEHLNKGLV